MILRVISLLGRDTLPDLADLHRTQLSAALPRREKQKLRQNASGSRHPNRPDPLLSVNVVGADDHEAGSRIACSASLGFTL
jgi:hypothetical protein